MKIKNKLYIKVIAVLFLFLSLGLFLYSCKKADKKVLFNLNGGNISGNTNSVEVLVKHGEKLSESQMPKPVKDKNRLAGWELDGALFNSEAEKIEKDITLTAKWIEQVSLSLPSDVKAEGIKDLTSIDKDTNVTLEYISQAGKTLKSFKINGEEKKNELVSNKITFKITQDTKVEIEYETSVVEENFSLTLPNEVKANVADLTKIKKGTDVELEFIPQAGKTLKSFKINGEEKKNELVSNKLTFKITQNTKVEIELENATNPLKAELDAEKAKVDALVQNGKIALTNDVTLENVKTKIEEVVDTTKVGVEVVEKEAGKKYEIKLTHKTDTTLVAVNEYEFEKVEDLTDLLNQIDEELEKIDNALISNLLEIELEQSQNITAEKVRERLNNIVDDSVVNINVTEVEAGKKYNVELVHKENEKAKKNKVYEVKKVLPTFELTIDSNFEVLEPQSLNLSKVKQGTKVKVKVNVPEHKEIKALTKNNIPVPMSEINNNEYEFEMTGNITLKVEFKVKQEYIQKLEEEFNKLSDVRVIAPDGNVQVEKVKEKLEELLDNSIVAKVEVVKKEDNKFEITLTHKLSAEATFTKDLTVLPEVVKVTLDLQGKATYKGMDKPVITVYKKSKLTEDKLPKANELVYTGNHGVFKSWTTDKDGNIPFEFNKIMNEDETIYAQYDASAHTVKFNIAEDILNKSNYDGFTARVLNEQTLEYPFSEEIVLPGYKLLKWVNKDTGTDFEFGVTKVEQNIEIKPVFDTTTYLKYKKLEDGSNNIRITGVKRGIANLYIPETLTVSGVKYTIVAIGDGAFFKNQDVKSVTILGEKLEEIHHSAFSQSLIEKIVLPKSLKVISNFAFYESYIKKVVIPASVENIGHYAFATERLEEVVFENANFTNISKNQFANSTWLKKGIENDDHALVVNGVLVYVDKTKSEDMVIPDGVKKLGEWVFADHKVTNLRFNQDLEEIGSYAFHEAVFNTGATMTIPKSVKYIGFRAFAFAGFTTGAHISKIDFEDGSKLTYIRGEAFYNTNIEEIVLPEGLTEVGDFAFNKSEFLSKITFPTSLVKFGFRALHDTDWFKEQSDNSHFVIANDTLLDASKMTAADTLPSVKRIAKGALLNIRGVQELTIPESVEYIYSYALYKNGILKTIKIPGTVKTIEKNAFIFETYYRDGKLDPIHLDVMISDVESAPTTWDNDWYELREGDAFKTTYYTFHWAYKNKVRFDLDGGNVSDEIKAQVLNKGEMATEPSVVPTKPGKVFVGWFLDDSVYDFTKPVVKSITLKAKYVDINPDYDLAYENNELVFVRLKNNTLKEFTIPENVEGAEIKRIKKDAFKDNTSIEKVVIPNSVKAIEDDAFNGDTNLGDITFGTGVKEFGKDFIKGTKWLSEKRVSDKAVVINKVLVDAKNLEENAELPENIEKISKYAFAENTTTKTLTIKEGVVEIEGNAFKGNTQIEKIILPSTMMLARKDAFAMGRSGNVEIDAQLVSHQKPRTWEDGYDNGDGATLEFKWKQVTTHKINLIDGITLTDPNLYADAIVSGSNVEIAVAQKQYHKITKFTINGVNKLDELKANAYKLTLNVTGDVTFELEYDLEDGIKDEFMNEFNKLQNTMGYVTETSDVAVDGKSHILRFVNTEIVDIEVSQNGDKYDVKMLSKKVLGYSQTLQNVEFVPVAKHNNPSSFGVTASGAANFREEGEYAFDNDYGTKWCDNYSPNKWIEADLKSEVFVAQVNIAHAEKGGEASSMNTRKYTIWYAGNDKVFHKWYVETNNRSAYTKHSFAGKKIRYIKMTVEQAEQTGNGASRIYEIELFTKTGLFTATFELNGGTVDGSSDNIVKKLPSGQLLDESIMPNVVKKNYIVEKWMIKSSNEPVVFGTTRINDDETYYPVFEPDPAIKAQLRMNRDKVNDIEFVIKDSEEILTEAEIKAHVEKLVDMDYVTVGLQIESGDTWKLTIKLKEDEEISVSKSVEFIKKKTGETVSVTFNLDGGLYEGNNNNIVYNIEKGTKLTDANIPDRTKLTKENNVFVDWYIDTKAVEPNGYLLKYNVIFKAKWAPKPASGSNLHKYIQDVEITQGYQSGWDEARNPLGYAYDLTEEGEANLTTAATVQFREDKKVELKFKFSQEVEIDKISLSFAGTWIPNYQSENLKKLDFYGSYDGVNFEKIGEMNNSTKENTVEVNLTKKRAIRYFKLYADMSFTAQGADLWEFYLTNISFFAV